MLNFSSTAIAAQKFIVSADKKITAMVAKDHLNRLQVQGSQVMEVIGDESKYGIYWSSDWRNLFIKPKIPAGQSFELTLVMAGGIAQDIKFITADKGGGQTVFIKAATPDPGLLTRAAYSTEAIAQSFLVNSLQHVKAEISLMMRAMINQVKDKYYVIKNQRVICANPKWLITQTIAYRYKNFSGAVLLVQNLTSKFLKLQEADFKHLFSRTVAITLSSPDLAPRAKEPIFIITRDSYDW